MSGDELTIENMFARKEIPFKLRIVGYAPGETQLTAFALSRDSILEVEFLIPAHDEPADTSELDTVMRTLARLNSLGVRHAIVIEPM